MSERLTNKMLKGYRLRSEPLGDRPKDSGETFDYFQEMRQAEEEGLVYWDHEKANWLEVPIFTPSRRSGEFDPVPYTVAEVLGRFTSVRSAGRNKWTAPCPAHQGKKRNLSLALGDKAWVFTCWSRGCAFNEIVDAVRLEANRLFWERK